ncbi:DNA primase [Acetivibrio cellulolyticus]|uniref:DNA primase n=1 Tax=Acetivibrio cellulolyticus TaxID=35830 RepID=UPI0001E2E6D5|nr:DNA primase [Acetivibrio cellulolyticus]
MFVKYPEELIEEIRMNNDILDVVGEYVKLEKKGKNYFGLCPFHREKTPSFSVDNTKQMYHCFGCGKGGSVIQFVMDAENLDYIEAIKLLAEKARITLPEGESEEEKKRALKTQEIIKINTDAARFYYEQLNDKKNLDARDYLQKRKVSEGVIKKFGLGYSSNEWNLLYSFLKSKNYSDEDLISSGLILAKKSGDGYFDRFRGRVMFPIFDLRGNVIGFGGRVLDDSLPKYMNSPETLVYNKRRNLYALNFAKNSGEKRIIVVEGYMDVISLYQFGIINTVASLGTALTESQGRILKKYAEEIIISYDADTAGQAATMRGLNLLDDIGCNVKVLLIPKGKDPDEFIKANGADAFKKLVDNALSLVEYKIKVLKSQIDTTAIDGKISFLNKAADILSKIDNSVEQEMYIKKISQEYDISQESMFAEVIKRVKPKGNYKPAIKIDSTKIKPVGNKTKSDENNLVHYERIILSLLSIDNSLYRKIEDRINLEFFTLEENRKAAEIIFTKIKDKKGIVPAELLNLVSNESANNFASMIQGECNFEDNLRAILDIIKKIEVIKLDKRQKEILNMISSSGNKEDVDRLKEELKSILIQKKSM